jgi:hypothetical protein
MVSVRVTHGNHWAAPHSLFLERPPPPLKTEPHPQSCATHSHDGIPSPTELHSPRSPNASHADGPALPSEAGFQILGAFPGFW